MTDLEYWRTRCELAEECLEQSPCDTDITRGQILAHEAYCNFIANNDAPLNYQVIGTAEMVELTPSELEGLEVAKRTKELLNK